MSSTADARSGFATFVRNQERILGTFSSTVPAETRRSTGLDLQHGVIVGLNPNIKWVADMSFCSMPELETTTNGAWSAYVLQELHCTLGSVVHMNDPCVSSSALIAENLGRYTSDLVDDCKLVKPKLLVSGSGDTIIVAGRPTKALFDQRSSLINPHNPAIVESGIEPGWGAHITLARARRPLTADEIATTNEWLNSTDLPSEIPLTSSFAGAFLANGYDFRFVEKY